MDTKLKLEVGLNSLNKAKNYIRNSNYGRAFAHYLVFFELVAHKKDKYEKQFTETLCIWGKSLEERNQVEDLCKCYLQALNYFPLNTQILNNFGAHLLRIGEYVEAKKYLQLAHTLAPDFLPAEKNLMTLRGELIERWHFPMLNDSERNMAYYKAILSYNIENNAKVLDVGTGCGLLSLFASNNENIASIQAIENSKILSSIAKCVFEENNVTKIKLHSKNSTTLSALDIDGYANLLITEIFDVGLFGENALETLIHAWDILLDKNAKIIPSSASLYVTGIECFDISRKYSLVREHKDLELTKICVTTNSDQPYESVNLKLLNYRQLTESKQVLTVDFSNLLQLKELQYNQNCFDIQSLKVINPGYLNAFAIWFDLHLDKNNIITTDPEKENVKCWEQAVKFINHSHNCCVDTDVQMSIHCQTGKLNINLLNEIATCNNCLKASEEVITLLNDNILTSALKKLYSPSIRKKIILDTFEFPLLGMKYAKNDNKLYCVAKNKTNKLFIEQICNINNISRENVIILEQTSLNQFFESKSYKFDIVILNPVCKNGTIYENLVTTYRLCKTYLNPGGLIYPQSLNLIIQVIESDYLYNFNVVNDENLFGFHIANHINEYSVNEHFDLDKNFPHKRLSEPQHMGNILSSDNEMVIMRQQCPIQQCKAVDGVVYWFEFIFNDENKIDTSCCTHYNYACFLINRQETKQENTELTVCMKYHQGIIKIYCETYFYFYSYV